MARARQDVVAERLKASALPGDTDTAQFHEALPTPRFRVQIAQIPAAIVFRLVEDKARITPLHLVLTGKAVFTALHVRFEHERLVADCTIQEDTGGVDIAGRIAALNSQIGVQIGGEILGRLFRFVRASALEQHFRQTLGRIDPQNQNGQLLRIVVQLDARGVDFLGREGFDALQRRRQFSPGLFGQQRADQGLEACAVDDEAVIAGQQHGQFAQHPPIEVQRYGNRDVAVVRVDVRPRRRILSRCCGRSSGGLDLRSLRIGRGWCRGRNLRHLLVGSEITCAGTQRGLARQTGDQGPRRRRQAKSPPEPHRVNRTVMGLDGSSWMPPVGILNTRRPPAGAR